MPKIHQKTPPEDCFAHENCSDSPLLALDCSVLTSTLLDLELGGLEALHGISSYSRYIRKHRALPPPPEATAIGLTMGQRVRGSDGKFYPPKSKAEKRFEKDCIKRRRQFEERYLTSVRLNDAIEALAQIAASHSRFKPVLTHQDSISRNLSNALSWLIRFADEVSANETRKSPQVACTAFRYCQQTRSEGHNDN